MVTIRPIHADDRERFFQLVQDNKERLADYFPITIEKAASLEVTSDSIRLYNILAEKNELYVMVMESNNKEMTGIIFLKNIDVKTGKCELAYFVDKNHENQGYTSTAIQQALDKAFNKLNLNKVYCRIAPDNTASNRVAIKNGFILEGVLKQEFRISDGSLVDLNYYGKLRNN